MPPYWRTHLLSETKPKHYNTEFMKKKMQQLIRDTSIKNRKGDNNTKNAVRRGVLAQSSRRERHSLLEEDGVRELRYGCRRARGIVIEVLVLQSRNSHTPLQTQTLTARIATRSLKFPNCRLVLKALRTLLSARARVLTLECRRSNACTSHANACTSHGRSDGSVRQSVRGAGARRGRAAVAPRECQ